MSAGRCFFHAPWKIAADNATRERTATAALDAWTPATDVVETENGWILWMETPGVAAEDVSIHLEGARLVVRGVRRPPTPGGCQRYRQLEIRHGVFEREIPLPGPVAENGASARLADGVLEIRLPRGDAVVFTLWAVRVLGR